MRGLWHWMRRRPSLAAACLYLGLLSSMALTADCMASDLPLVAKFQGHWYLLPSLLGRGRLSRFDNESLKKAMGPKDWALFPPVIYGPNQAVSAGRFEPSMPPGADHILGTDDVGRDVLAGLIHGCRSALFVGLGSVAIYLVLGLFLGLAAGFFGGIVDKVITWAVTVLVAFPTLILVLVVRGALGRGSTGTLVLIIGLTGWAGLCRLVRGEVLTLVSAPHVTAARALGAGPLRIVTRHILPFALGPAFVSATFGVAWAILAESAVSFLGLSGDSPSWGRLLASARQTPGAWWLVVPAALALLGTVLSLNVIADALRSRWLGRSGETRETTEADGFSSVTATALRLR